MTEAAGAPTPRPEPSHGARPRKERLPRAWVRATAWIVGASAFLIPWIALGVHPKTAVSASGQAHKNHRQRPVVIVHKVLRRVVVQQPSSGGVQYVYSGGGTTGSTSTSSSGGTAPAPAPPPVTSTGGS